MQKAITYFTRNLNFHSNRDFAKDILNKAPQTLGEVYKIAQGHISINEALRALYPWANKSRIMGRMETTLLPEELVILKEGEIGRSNMTRVPSRGEGVYTIDQIPLGYSEGDKRQTFLCPT